MAEVEIRGTITKFRYKSDTSSFKIAEFQPDDPKDGILIMLKGLIDQSNLDMPVVVRGVWVDNPQYGKQVEVTSCMRSQPISVESIEKWMRTTIKGIGPTTSTAIADLFGDELKAVITDDWEKMCKIKRVSKATAQAIHDAWIEDALKREVNLLLIQGNISSTDFMINKVIKRFGDNAVARITDNPYRLTEIPGIGFKTADIMARRMGWQPNRPERVEAAMSYLLEEAAKEGHSFLHRAELVDAVRKLAAVEVQGKEELLSEQEALGAITRVLERSQSRPVEERDLVMEKVTIDGVENQLCYLPRYWLLETTATKRVADLQSTPQIPPNNLDKVLKTVEKKLNITLSEQQRDAVLQALTHNCSVITGLPGTGKTSTCQALIETATAIGLSVILCAPTGRAAKRLQEVTGYEAKTIHRTLAYIPQEDRFTYGKEQPLPCDMLIVDEASMLDLELMVSVLEAVPDTCSVVWIGDVNQLPSIDAGMVLRDLINSKRVHTTFLNKIFRQAEGSLIIQNAHRIYRGETPKFPMKGTDADSYWVPIPRNSTIDGGTDSIDFAKSMLPKLYAKLQSKYGFDPIEDIQVLTPMRVGPAGYLVFNEVIQNIVNPDGERIEVAGKVFRENDRVMQTVNNYKLDVYNGDVGFVRSIDMEEKFLEIEFVDKTVFYPFQYVPELVLAYASSVHKAQGSEFKCVILLLLSHHHVMLDRNIIYTANTRARKMAIYLASRYAIDTAVSTQKVLKRNSLLAQRLRAVVPKLPEYEK